MIKFDKELHLYFNEKGYIVPSVTEINNTVYGSGLENAPTHLVAARRTIGTAVHSEAETLVKTGKLPDNPSAQALNFATYYAKNIGKFYGSKKTEYILQGTTAYGDFCGTADLIAGGWIVDYKTSKTATKEQKLHWQRQLSFYYYAWKNSGAFQAQFESGVTFKGLLVLHLTADGCEEIPLDYLGDDFVTETMRLYSEGKQAEKPAPATELQTVDNASLAKFADTVKQIKALEEQAAAVKEAIKAEMESRKILNLQIGDLAISYVAPTVRKSFDSARFKKEHADLWPLYQKSAEVKSSIRISVSD